MVRAFKNEFEEKLVELGLSYGILNDVLYTITSEKGGKNHIEVQLVSSLQPVKHIHGSKNGNYIQAIGVFKFKVQTGGQEPNLYILALQNPVKNQAEFLIIPIQVFLRKHIKKNHGRVRRKSVEMVIWLMEDDCVYETTNISIEAEWYFMSKGVRGRMADGTEMDYSKYLNGWRVITDS